jgi:hypothetical protein
MSRNTIVEKRKKMRTVMVKRKDTEEEGVVVHVGVAVVIVERGSDLDHHVVGQDHGGCGAGWADVLWDKWVPWGHHQDIVKEIGDKRDLLVLPDHVGQQVNDVENKGSVTLMYQQTSPRTNPQRRLRSRKKHVTSWIVVMLTWPIPREQSHQHAW